MNLWSMMTVSMYEEVFCFMILFRNLHNLLNYHWIFYCLVNHEIIKLSIANVSISIYHSLPCQGDGGCMRSDGQWGKLKSIFRVHRELLPPHLLLTEHSHHGPNVVQFYNFSKKTKKIWIFVKCPDFKMWNQIHNQKNKIIAFLQKLVALVLKSNRGRWYPRWASA